eukprot:753771-Hanusia_phi.AAC.3
MGGGNGAQGLLGMHIFDLEVEDGEVRGSWSILRAGYAHSTSCLTVAREGAACVMQESRLFLFGGFNGRYLNDVMMLRLERDADWAHRYALLLSPPCLSCSRVQDGSLEELRDACRQAGSNWSDDALTGMVQAAERRPGEVPILPAASSCLIADGREQREKDSLKNELNRLRTEHATPFPSPPLLLPSPHLAFPLPSPPQLMFDVKVRAMLAQLEKMYYNSPIASTSSAAAVVRTGAVLSSSDGDAQRGGNDEGWLVHAMRALTSRSLLLVVRSELIVPAAG